MYIAQICYAIENWDENGCVMLNSADWRIETVLILIEEFGVHQYTTQPLSWRENAMARLAPYHCLLSNSQDEESTISIFKELPNLAEEQTPLKKNKPMKIVM